MDTDHRGTSEVGGVFPNAASAAESSRTLELGRARSKSVFLPLLVVGVVLPNGLVVACVSWIPRLERPVERWLFNLRVFLNGKLLAYLLEFFVSAVSFLLCVESTSLSDSCGVRSLLVNNLASSEYIVGSLEILVSLELVFFVWHFFLKELSGVPCQEVLVLFHSFFRRGSIMKVLELAFLNLLGTTRRPKDSSPR